ncbi:hypothetical protein CO123_00255 [bacterium (Candidatus Howlettbacteria) CG_4_9_14_3_um_filter_37_10]|nr:MAG: hypothetical protein COX25_02500 [bacterium (Candidatus Howlettbacteria) CG23_combo_of_CG06-09_8_20_14_all_37_9]PJB07331.1 MAG: hypothetical protein CO123_00255 [bacterium (Candidatus Howlettbacteria) CG_4_9_14_3_um_filter_37_10]
MIKKIFPIFLVILGVIFLLLHWQDQKNKTLKVINNYSYYEKTASDMARLNYKDHFLKLKKIIISLDNSNGPIAYFIYNSKDSPKAYMAVYLKNGNQAIPEEKVESYIKQKTLEGDDLSSMDSIKFSRSDLEKKSFCIEIEKQNSQIKFRTCNMGKDGSIICA